MPAIHLQIKGEVQGVFYRATAKKVADRLKITGWVKNTAEGNVEAEVTGNDQQLNEFITWCKQGPEKARVTDVIITPGKETFFTEFEVIRGR
jgi:acylphosphatase